MANRAPLSPTWVAAVHATAEDFTPLGTAVVIDDRRVLTSAHVVRVSGVVRPQLWVAFPMSEDPCAPRRRVVEVRLAEHSLADLTVADLAVLQLADPVPDGLAAAPLRCPKPADLLDRAWWAFGFADCKPQGNVADGTVGAALAYGWVRLDTNSRYPVQQGFSGGGLWRPDYGAVVGVVGQANGHGDAQAITLYQANGYLRAEHIDVLARILTCWRAGRWGPRMKWPRPRGAGPWPGTRKPTGIGDLGRAGCRWSPSGPPLPRPAHRLDRDRGLAGPGRPRTARSW